MDREARRRWWLVGSALAACVVALIVWGMLRAGDGSPEPSSPAGDSAPATPQSSSSGTAPGAAPGASSPGSATEAPMAPSLAPVAPDATVVTDSGAAVQIVGIASIDGVATAPGETSGPAMAVRVRIENRGGAPIDAEFVVVQAAIGATMTPLPELQSGGSPFSGSIAPGASAEGVTVFSATDTERADVWLGVDVVAGAPTVTFRGDMR